MTVLMEDRIDQSAEEKRIRMIVDTTEELKRAVELRSLKLGVQRRRKVPHHEVVNEILQAALEQEIAELRAIPPEDKPRRRR